MSRQCSFTNVDIDTIIYRRKLLRYDVNVEIRNRRNYNKWYDKWIHKNNKKSIGQSLYFDAVAKLRKIGAL